MQRLNCCATSHYMNLTSFLLLLLGTASWGISYVGTRWASQAFDPNAIVFVRFALSSIVFLPLLFFNKIGEIKKQLSYGPILCGVILMISIQLQITGLQYTSVAKSSFLTAMFAFFTPLLVVIIDKKKLEAGFWPLLTLALFGIFLMCDLDFNSLNKGDTYTIACAFFCALHIYLVGKFASNSHPLYFVLLQNITITFVSLVQGLVFYPFPDFTILLQDSTYAWGQAGSALAILTFVCTILPFTIQVYAQRKVPSHIASMIFLMESPFAAMFGYFFLSERITTTALTGAVLIICAISFLPYASRLISRRNAVRNRRVRIGF